MMRRGFAYALLWLTAVAGAIGCSGGGPVPTYSVTGTVKLSDGSPLSGGGSSNGCRATLHGAAASSRKATQVR